jgi:Methyltransferase domain
MHLRRRAAPILIALAGGLVAAVATALGSLVGLASMIAVVPVGIVVAAVLVSALSVRDRLLAADRRSTERLATGISNLSSRTKRMEIQQAEIAGIAAFATMNVPYPLPLGGRWALGWEGAVILAREIGVGIPATVVELGSGASSLVIGMQLRQAGRGHLYTLDHEPDFAALTRRHVAAMGLDAWVSVLDAPLVDQDVDGETYRWYRLPAEVTGLERIDALVVDGPPQRTDRGGMPRFPALPMLGAQMGPGSLVFVDDALREGEQRMLERWCLAQPEWALEVVATRHGTALLRWHGDHGAGERSSPAAVASTTGAP